MQSFGPIANYMGNSIINNERSHINYDDPQTKPQSVRYTIIYMITKKLQVQAITAASTNKWVENKGRKHCIRSFSKNISLKTCTQNGEVKFL